MAFNLNKNEESKSSSKFDLSKSDTPQITSEGKSGNSKNWLFGFLGVLVLVAGVWYFLSKSGSKADNENIVSTTTAVDSNKATEQSNRQNDVAVATTPADTSASNKPENSGTADISKTASSDINTDPQTNINNTNTVSAKPVSSSSLNSRTTATFRKGSNSIINLDNSLVEDIVSFLKKNPSSLITVNGYASSEGELAVNQKISQLRADAFKKYLIAKGIQTNRIIASGKGIENPIATNDTEDGRKKNRRVEVMFQ